MKNFLETVRSLRQLKSLIGIGKKEFELLLEIFTEVLEERQAENYRSNRSNRSRRPGGGRKSKLSNPSDKLFFILCYLKTYPTFDVLGFMFDLNPSKASENVKKLLPILKLAQSKLNLLPLRKLKGKPDLENLLETDCQTQELIGPDSLKVSEPQSDEIAVATPEKEILIDVTEREHFRPQKPKKQKKHYSGKKKTHTVKNTIISDSKKRILFLGQTFPGSVHDYKMLKKEFSPKKDWFSSLNVCVDLGYQGIKTDYQSALNIYIPHKKPRKSKDNPNPSLTKKQKSENKEVGKRRVFVEHAIGGMKAFHILSTRFRNRSSNFVDEAIIMVAGLWNLKNSF